MDAGKVFVLLLALFALGLLAYLQWLSKQSKQESSPSPAADPEEKKTDQGRNGKQSSPPGKKRGRRQ